MQIYFSRTELLEVLSDHASKKYGTAIPPNEILLEGDLPPGGALVGVPGSKAAATVGTTARPQRVRTRTRTRTRPVTA